MSEVFILFDDESVRKKINVITKWEAMMDDARNSDDFGDRVDEMLQLGKKYRVTVEEVKDDANQ